MAYKWVPYARVSTTKGIRERLAPAGCAALEAIDLTFCELVGYTAVIALRNSCPKLRLIRRQPEWMDGAITTPWVCVQSGDATLHAMGNTRSLGWGFMSLCGVTKPGGSVSPTPRRLCGSTMSECAGPRTISSKLLSRG